ncbi:hypothetical protein IAD21_04574 [Abditibacteriota bacterium]|nr:hypothetical protein IAD21_04574 [Abditibacteriota bacterium]
MEETGMPPREWILGGLFLVRQCLGPSLQHICGYLCLICVHLWLKILPRTPTPISPSPITAECVT